MITTAYHPYPVDNDNSSALQPHIYPPSESHSSPRNTMYPSSSPPPNYIYSGYEQYYSKDSWVAAAASSWPTFYPLPPRSSSLPDATVNPKVTNLPSQPILVSDIDTPSSISSHSILTPSSPFTQEDVGGMEFQAMEFDEFDCDDEKEFIDSDFADEMDGIDETYQGPSSLYGASAPHATKSTSALDGALGDAPSPPYGTSLDVFTPADRRLSASVPGYPSNSSHRPTVSNRQRWTEKTYSPTLAGTSLSPTASYPSRPMYTRHNYSSSASLFAPPSLYNHSSSSSLAGAFPSSVPSPPRASRPTSHPLPILQPQPIRPIPPIPLADLASSANESRSPEPRRSYASCHLRTLSPLPLLCQPVSDAIRYQLKESPASGTTAGDSASCYDDVGNVPESMCPDLVTPSEGGRFTQQGLAFCPEPSSASGTCAIEEMLYSCGCIHLPVRWQ